MTAQILRFTGDTILDLPCDHILQKAIDTGLKSVVIIGITEQGEEYLASSSASLSKCAWHIQRGLHHLNQIADEHEDKS